MLEVNIMQILTLWEVNTQISFPGKGRIDRACEVNTSFTWERYLGIHRPDKVNICFIIIFKLTNKLISSNFTLKKHNQQKGYLLEKSQYPL